MIYTFIKIINMLLTIDQFDRFLKERTEDNEETIV